MHESGDIFKVKKSDGVTIFQRGNGSLQSRQKSAHCLVVLCPVTQGKFRIHGILHHPPIPGLADVPFLFQIADDRPHGPLRDAYLGGKFTGGDLMTGGHQEEGCCIVRNERPLFHHRNIILN